MTACHSAIEPTGRARSRRPRLAVVTLLACLVLGGCTARLLYDRVDWFIVWKIQGFVSLTREQESALKNDIQAHLDFVRVNELPWLASLLEQTAREIETGYVTPDMIDARYFELMAVYDEFMLGIVPPAQRFLRSLSPGQVEELSASLTELNDEMYEEYSGRTAEQREENRNRAAIRGIEDFTGRLDDEQREIIRAGLARMADASEQWIANQREWQRRFRELIETRPPPDQYKAQLTELFVYPRHFHSAEYRARVDSNRLVFNEMFAELVNSLDERQREKMVRKIEKYVKTLRGLAESA